MEEYDPLRAPSPAEWSELGESEQLELVMEYHRRIGDTSPSPQGHAVAHTVVENQNLLGDETPVAATLARLMDEGLDLHAAIHAIAYVLLGVVHRIKQDKSAFDANAVYFAELEQLTAEKWLSDRM